MALEIWYAPVKSIIPNAPFKRVSNAIRDADDKAFLLVTIWALATHIDTLQHSQGRNIGRQLLLNSFV